MLFSDCSYVGTIGGEAWSLDCGIALLLLNIGPK